MGHLEVREGRSDSSDDGEVGFEIARPVRHERMDDRKITWVKQRKSKKIISSFVEMDERSVVGKVFEFERVVATRCGIEAGHVTGGRPRGIDEVDVELAAEAGRDEEEVVTKIVDEDHWQQDEVALFAVASVGAGEGDEAGLFRKHRSAALKDS